ncbi:hypothetical protein POM88_021976 [Heracleum sosnowskyi]|uniref:Uncharacterized protein n=1 Tax=Heracleum sosnowskyi TaxID=360622 RepID=A0AAD8MT21_9APIA|nr:hypothetical protein POM88_021976 [Heracleum sosnowskyi]
MPPKNVLNECAQAEAWLREKKQQHDSLSKHSTLVLLSTDVKRKAEALDRFCRPIMTKPKPKLAKPATPEVSSPSGDQSQGSENFDSASKDDMDGQYERVCLHFNNSPLVLPSSVNRFQRNGDSERSSRRMVERKCGTGWRMSYVAPERDVVSCAAVGKSRRCKTKEIVRTPEQCGLLMFPMSLKQPRGPGPRD